MSHSSRGAWIEIPHVDTLSVSSTWSHSSRGAWIEILLAPVSAGVKDSRTPHGVRGLKLLSGPTRNPVKQSHSSRGAWIEMPPDVGHAPQGEVALLTGCVD